MITITWPNIPEKVAGIEALAGRIYAVHAPKWGEEVSEIGERVVNAAVMDGGINKTKIGGPRIRTWAMHDSVASKVSISPGGNSITATAGFLNNAPDHTIFQERGTRDRRIDSVKPRLTPTSGKGRGRGIPPMLAIPQAAADMEIAAEVTGGTMISRIAREYNSI